MQGNYIETDPLKILERERSYGIHKQKISTIEKIIDNSSPSTTRLTKYISKSPMPSNSVKENNLRIYHKLNQIYSRPISHPKTLVSIKTSPLINRKKQAARIATENELLAMRLINKKSAYTLKEFQTCYKETEEYKDLISKSKKLKNSKSIVKKMTKNNEKP